DLEPIIDIAIITAPGNFTDELRETEAPSPIATPSPTTTSTRESTTTLTTNELPSTSLSLREQLRDDYRNFTELFIQTFSESGLDNYANNSKLWVKHSVTFVETQFADLSEEQLVKILSRKKDQKRDDSSRRCDVHTYHGDRQEEGNIIGSNLYEDHDRIPSRVDLRRRGIIGAVRNQGTSCSAGYAFAVTNLVESRVDTNGSSLSVQMLLADHFNHHCEGGETYRAMESV
ncbi:hypothetical protein PENTCL1PPCAC_28853, partial [Pristionchus entomophagus]